MPSTFYIVQLLLAIGNIFHWTESILGTVTLLCQNSILGHQYGFLVLPHSNDV